LKLPQLSWLLSNRPKQPLDKDENMIFSMILVTLALRFKGAYIIASITTIFYSNLTVLLDAFYLDIRIIYL